MSLFDICTNFQNNNNIDNTTNIIYKKIRFDDNIKIIIIPNNKEYINELWWNKEDIHYNKLLQKYHFEIIKRKIPNISYIDAKKILTEI